MIRGNNTLQDHLLAGKIDPQKPLSVDPEDLRWAARRRMALWSFRIMGLLAFGLIQFGLFYPNGATILNQLSAFIFTLYGSFTSVVLGYMGIDAVSRKKGDPYQGNS